MAPSELARNYKQQLIETARKSLALRREFSGRFVRFRRAAQAGPNSELALVFIKKPGCDPVVEIWPYSEIEALASGVTDEDAFREIDRHAGLDGEGEGV